MKYILDNYGIFNPRDFQRPFTFGTPNMKPELVEYVIKTYKVDLKGENGFHIMRFAFNQGYIDLIKYLLDQGVMLQTKDRIMKSKATTMMNDKEEEEEEYKVRLSVNVFENVMDEVTHTNIEAYKLILENGGRANAKGQGVRNSLLDYHSMKGNFEVVKILVEHGACISKNTLFQCRDYRILCFLIDHAKQKILGKNLESLINNDTRLSGFLYYFRNHSIKNISLNRMLSCLSRALEVRNEGACIYILNNVTITGIEDQECFPKKIDSWLLDAIEMNSAECVKLLLDVLEKSQLTESYFDTIQDYKFELDSAADQDYYLHAAKLNNQEIVKILIEHKVPINHNFHNCLNNALFWAAVRGNFEIINLLLEYGYEKLDLQEEDISLFHISPDFVNLISK
ncbi:hypothetical protein TVAG_374910 [Trichomonas vaginalis G3]|uniref:DUF3447 domain-containing protein n=1 Tax=Trichomonas vaginalis (strain ATCC PRA-98 / G3) TaxID=412133 RepID=A2GD70_TRIV3|nr:hypothetical protein TVAGG3_0911650 [Trichomonas vaginalis G3]EAX84898.1 hypothetical protein TVAG_374910 [Trichomonas vaginalis G3]KAI5484470.1 hypothetical protein TVAGG3_0911650 [Trichomonas vaginalis G3]|eukprot:XP_001297828.1 hypothetical protein [Trichomonas vaginalis G3]